MLVVAVALLLTPPSPSAAATQRSLSALDASAEEAAEHLSFPVLLSRKAKRTVKVEYETQAATATEGSDYEGGAGILRFHKGQKRKSIRVTVADDSLDEADETLQVLLSDPSRATLSDATAVGTILDDDPESLPDDCRLQAPSAVTAQAGETVTVYGQVREAGLTDQSESNDPSITSQVGYGPDGSDPSGVSWTFVAAGPNPGYGSGSPGFEAAYDEHVGSFSAPSAAQSPYDYAYRFSLDGGNSYAYCDLNGSSNGYSAANAGQMITTP